MFPPVGAVASLHAFLALFTILYIVIGEATGYSKVPCAALVKGELNVEVRGLPADIKFKAPSEMEEASLTMIIQHTDQIEFVEKASLDERILDGGGE